MSNEAQLLEMAKAFFKYTDAELATVMANPDYRTMLQKAPQLMQTDFVFEVDRAHGCACQHEVGQQIVINGDGSIHCRESPEKVCLYLLNAMGPIVYGAQEFIFAGLDPNALKFKTVGCFDTGVQCGGFGHVTVRFGARPR
jgi:uncharacterized repeat protein (TIGR04076 family)